MGQRIRPEKRFLDRIYRILKTIPNISRKDDLGLQALQKTKSFLQPNK
jgi:hypothetical protein